MAISFVSYASALSGSLTLPTHMAGDLILVHACHESSIPGTASGWQSPLSTGGASMGGRLYFKIAASASETLPTISSTRITQAAVYRSSDKGLHPTVATGAAASSSTISFNATSAAATSFEGNSWSVGFGYCENSTATINDAPTSWTNRGYNSDSTNNMAAFCVDFTSYANATKSLGVTINNFGIHVGLIEVDNHNASGGGVPLIGTGGLVY